MQFLERTPEVLNARLKGIDTDWTSKDEGDKTWSAYDVVGHFIHGEKTDWIPGTEVILSNNLNKAFAPFERSAQFEESKGKSLEELLDEFKICVKKMLSSCIQKNY